MVGNRLSLELRRGPLVDFNSAMMWWSPTTRVRHGVIRYACAVDNIEWPEMQFLGTMVLHAGRSHFPPIACRSSSTRQVVTSTTTMTLWQRFCRCEVLFVDSSIETASIAWTRWPAQWTSALGEWPAALFGQRGDLEAVASFDLS